MSTNPPPPVNAAQLLQNTQAMSLLAERGLFSRRDVRATLKAIYPWMPIEELPDDFPVPNPADEPEDFTQLTVPDGSDDDLEVE